MKNTMTTAEAALYLGITVDSLRNLQSRGFVRRLRGHFHPFRFSKVELDRYLKDEVVA